MAKNNKLIAGITLAIIYKLISRESAAHYEEHRDELYTILDAANFRFDNDKQIWVERKFKKRHSPRVKAVVLDGQNVASGANSFVALVRVIAPEDEIDYIVSQMGELFPCLNAEILSTSKRYPGNGTWDRVYLRVKFEKVR